MTIDEALTTYGGEWIWGLPTKDQEAAILLAAEVKRLRAALERACTPPYPAGGTPGILDGCLVAFHVRHANPGKAGKEKP